MAKGVLKNPSLLIKKEFKNIMVKTILIIIVSVSIFGIIVFSVVRQTMQKINELVEEEKRKKGKK